MNSFGLSSRSRFKDSNWSGNQLKLLISIALKQFETANALYAESEKIKSALKSLEEHKENGCAALADINKTVEEALLGIIMQKISLQAELHKLIE